VVNPVFSGFSLLGGRRTMQITVNGQTRDIPDGETIRALVARYNLTPEKVAIELNRRLLRSEKYDTALQNGDQVEIVTFVGGG
jgi:thiamine biosynthesis protein ThiS